MSKIPLIFLRILTITLVVIVVFLVKKHHYRITENTVQAATCRDIPQNLIITKKVRGSAGEICCDLGEVRVACSQFGNNVDRNHFIPLKATEEGECCYKNGGTGSISLVCARLG